MEFRWAVSGALVVSWLLSSSPVNAQDRIYWADSLDGAIHRLSLDTLEVETLIEAIPFGKARFVLVDDRNDQVFVIFFDSARGESEIRRYDLDGNELPNTPIVGELINGLTIDHESSRLIFGAGSNGEIFSSSFDGSDILPLLDFGGRFITGIPKVDISSGDLFATAGDLGSLKSDVLRASLDGSSVQILAADGLRIGQPLELDTHRRRLFFLLTGTPNRLMRMSTSGADQMSIIELSNAAGGAMAIDEVRRKLYYTDGSPGIGFFRSDLDGSNIEELFRGPFLPIVLSLLISDQGICDVVDLIESHYAVLATELNLADDLDADGLPELVSLRMIEAVAKAYKGYKDFPLGRATEIAFDLNLDLFDGESVSDGFTNFREGIAALMIAGGTVESSFRTAAATQGMETLLADYSQVTCADGTADGTQDCSPSVAGRASRSVNEPYSGGGDPDGDGLTNAEEWAGVVASGGTIDDFIANALAFLVATADSGGGGSGGGGCFIATAAYGSPLEAELDIFRGYRDGTLLPYTTGSLFVDGYYRLSPGLAEWLAKHPAGAQLVRSLLSLLLAVAPYRHAWGMALIFVGLCLVAHRRLRTNRRLT